jgi:SAM-dependent methyltransferase
MRSLKRILARGLDSIGLGRVSRSVWKRTTNFGLRYRCPFCGARLRAFLPGGESHRVLAEKSVVGGGPRSTMTCPVCLAIDRERAVYLFLTKRPQMLARAAKLLHIAPEWGLGAWLRSLPQLDYISADLDRPDVDLNLDLTKIPFPHSTFDAIMCCHVLEHIPDDAKAMSEILRILKPGGWAIIQTYEDFSITDPAEREQAFGQSDHVRIYGMDYVTRLKCAGFKVEVCPNSRDDIARFGLIERECIFATSRPNDSPN